MITQLNPYPVGEENILIEGLTAALDKPVIRHSRQDLPGSAAALAWPHPLSFAGLLQFARSRLRFLPLWSRPAEEVLEMKNAPIGEIKIRDEDDALALQYLGAAVLLSWLRIPQETRELLLVQSGAITGLKSAPALQDQIKWLLRSNVKTAARP
jgi:hypothetical protein